MPVSAFVAIPLLVVGVVGYWLHRRLLVATGIGSVRVRVLVDLALLALTGAMVGGLMAPMLGWHGPAVRALAWVGLTWMGAVFYLLMGLLAVALLSGMVRIAGVPRRRRYAAARRRLNRVGSVVVIALSLAATAYGLVVAGSPQVRDTRLVDPDLPEAFEGTRIALITDLHAGVTHDAAFTRRVVDLTNAARPDLVVLGGDLVDGTVAAAGAELAPLRDLSAPLGVFAVTGNHEMFSSDVAGWERYWGELGITVLHNDHSVVTRGADSIVIAGVEDATGGNFPVAAGTDASTRGNATSGTIDATESTDFAPDVDRALSGIDPSTFTILAAHQPIQAVPLTGRGVDLQVSGHTHGGQLWPLGHLVRLQQPTLGGLQRVGQVAVLTSRGVGEWGPPIRVGAPAEIPVITLSRG